MTALHLLALGVSGSVAVSASGDDLPQSMTGSITVQPVHATYNPMANSVSYTSFSDTWNLSTQPTGVTNSSASCASTSCHGGPRPGVTAPAAARGAEVPLWRARDPHARAWRTLCSPQSVAILQQLQILNGDQIVNQQAFANCLACHNTDVRSESLDNSEAVREGVSCESCHGASDSWQRLHYQAQWPSISSQAKTVQLKFVDNEDLLTRARVCASCHVGDGQHDMNHDMIAAGHPPLLYELTTYHNRLPKHWRDVRAGDRQRYETSLWLAGQVAALDAQLALIESRAGQGRAWPEFSNFDCAACHQPLLVRTSDGNIDDPNVDAGTQPRASWSKWNRWGIEQLLGDQHQSLQPQHGAPIASRIELQRSLTELGQALEAVPNNRQAVKAAAAHARILLDTWLREPSTVDQFSHFTADQLRQVVLSATEVLPSSLPEQSALKTSRPNWESLAQLYLAGVAARAAWPAATDASKPAGAQAKSSSLNGQPIQLARQLREHLLFAPDKMRAAFQLDAHSTQAASQFLKALKADTGTPTSSH